METNLDHGIEWIHGTLRLYMINSMSPNLGFSLNCILTLDFLKLRWVKPTRNKISKEFPFLIDFMIKCQVIELGFRINPNKFLSLTCVGVVTHIRVMLGEIHGRFLKKYM